MANRRLNQFRYSLENMPTDIWMNVSFGRARFPAGTEPRLINFQFFVWAEESATVKCMFSGKVNYNDLPHPVKPKTWEKISSNISESRASDKKTSLTKSEVISGLQIIVDSKTANSAAYVTDICVTSGALPDEVMPRLFQKLAKLTEVLRLPAKDGFTYSETANGLLKAAVKDAGKRRDSKKVLVIGGHPDDGATMLKALKSATAKSKATAFSFVAATAPDNSPLGGVDDMRTLLSYNIEKTNAEFVLLLFRNAVTAKGDLDYEGIRACLERALEAGCIPVICMPPNGGKAESFIRSVSRYCSDLGIAWVDTDSALKSNARAMENNEVGAEGFDSLATVAFNAIKHVDTYIHR